MRDKCNYRASKLLSVTIYICCSIRYMTEETPPYRVDVDPSRGVGAADVERAADALLRAGERPTVERVRQKIGRGSPNTINPLLDAWWKRLAGRLDAGPAALHRLPEVVLHTAEALWLHALQEARIRVRQELGVEDRRISQTEQALQVRSHVLTLREGELDRRLQDRDGEIALLRQRIRDLEVRAAVRIAKPSAPAKTPKRPSRVPNQKPAASTPKLSRSARPSSRSKPKRR